MTLLMDNTASADNSITSGAGFVQTFSLMASFTRGILQYIYWWNANCDACGGKGSATCLVQPTSNVLTCATPLNNCTCGLATPPIPSYACNYNSRTFTQCNSGIQTSFLGSDGKTQPFTTGLQVQRLSSLSLVSLYYTVIGFLNAGLNSTQDYWNQIKSDSAGQSIDGGGGSPIGRRRLMQTIGWVKSLLLIGSGDNSRGNQSSSQTTDVSSHQYDNNRIHISSLPKRGQAEL